MTFLWSTLSSLLCKLEDVECHDPPFLAAEKAARLQDVTKCWFKSHRHHIDKLDVPGAVALLSSLLPERRNDRVYGIQATSLCRILGRVLRLSASRMRVLQAYRQPGQGDLAECLKRVLVAGGPPAWPPVGLQEVDDMLHLLAGQSVFSDPSIVKSLPPGSSELRDDVLASMFHRVTPNEAEWLVRLILKDLSPVKIYENLILKSFHFLLPDLLRFQSNFGAAATLLKTVLREFPECPDPRSERLLRRGAATLLRPAVGTKVGRPDLLKARSIENCLNMLGGRRWVLERKYDGEYCEVHIDLQAAFHIQESIRIFSKSGKDSTQDRQGVHSILIDCLQLGKPECKIKRQAILLGELVVYDTKTKCIAPFNKIRKHVSRSGISLGTMKDSPKAAHEHLAIVFFDVLLHDDDAVMTRPVEERRERLRQLYRKIPGKSMGAEWKIVDFADKDVSRKRLVDQFAASIAHRCEGLILKPCGIPYFPMERSDDSGVNAFIKLKKDYINGMGDEADLAVIGASYNAQRGMSKGLPGLKWTDFYLACLVNKAAVERYAEKPVFKVIGVLCNDHCIPPPILAELNRLARTYGVENPGPESSTLPFDLRLDGMSSPAMLYSFPPVLEVLGSGFEKPFNCSFFMLRHARVTKLHRDRSWKECVSFPDLQQQAAEARTQPVDGESQEIRKWISKLEKSHRRKDELRRSPRSETTTTPSRSDSSLLLRQSPLKLRRVQDASADMQVLSIKRREAEAVNQSLSPTKGRKKIKTSLAHTSQRSTEPLADITNQAPAHAAHQLPLPSKPTTLVHSNPSLNHSQPFLTLPPCSPCLPTHCPLSDTTIYIDPSLSSHPSPPPTLLHTLLHRHDTIPIPTLSHWDRDAFAHPPSSEDTVSESQSHGERRKVVLVDTDTQSGSEDGDGEGGSFERTIREVEELNGGCMRERVEVWDWRCVVGCAGNGMGRLEGRGNSGGRGGREVLAEMRRKWFLGAVMFDEGIGRAAFVAVRGGR